MNPGKWYTNRKSPVFDKEPSLITDKSLFTVRTHLNIPRTQNEAVNESLDDDFHQTISQNK